MGYSFSIESIIEKMSKRIYEDAKSKSNRAKKLWQQINEELKRYNNTRQFEYEINSPSAYSSNYEINFISTYNEKVVHYDSLSSGEKIIFELICYYFTAKNNNKLKMIILDEFDANLNPALAELYLSIIKQQFCQKNIITILTTHSPSTVVEVDPDQLFELSIEDGSQKIKNAKTKEGKKSILKKLAPKFVYYSEFGNLEYVLKDKSNTIIFVEGKNDKKKIKESSNDTVIHCDGAGNIKNMIVCLKSMPFLKDIIKNKLIIALYDFDEEGRKSIQEQVGPSTK